MTPNGLRADYYFRFLAGASSDGLGGWLVSGGSSRGGYLDSTEIFKDGVWTAGPKLPTKLSNHCQVEVNGKVIITGGRIDYHGTNQTLMMEADTWNIVASMKEARYFHTCVEFQGEVFVFGGSSPNLDILASVEIYNPAADSWRSGTDLPIALDLPQAFVHNDIIYVLAGEGLTDTNRKIFYLSGPDYNIWNVLSVDLELSSERVFINPPVLTEELISC